MTAKGKEEKRRMVGVEKLSLVQMRKILCCPSRLRRGPEDILTVVRYRVENL
jgi:hypothetical protein